MSIKPYEIRKYFLNVYIYEKYDGSVLDTLLVYFFNNFLINAYIYIQAIRMKSIPKFNKMQHKSVAVCDNLFTLTPFAVVCRFHVYLSV